jgi:hypothetical protein
MSVDRIIEWMGQLSGGEMPVELRTERIIQQKILQTRVRLNMMLNPDQENGEARSPEDVAS